MLAKYISAQLMFLYDALWPLFMFSYPLLSQGLENITVQLRIPRLVTTENTWRYSDFPRKKAGIRLHNNVTSCSFC